MRFARARALCFALLVGTIAPGSALRGQPEGGQIRARGPQVGDTVPPFSGTDQFGRARTLDSLLGPKGAMLVFFRSADW